MRQEDRVLQTKQAFRKALLHLLEEKPINKITVRELTDLTGYNRSTFYLYYQDIYALKEDMEHAVFEEVWNRMIRHSTEEMQKSITPLMQEMFEYFDENKEVFRIISSNNSYMELSQEVLGLVQNFAYTSWDSVFPDANRKQYAPFYHYFISGLLSLVMYWITEGSESIEEISETAARLVYAGVPILFDET